MPGPARLVPPLLLALQQLLEGAAACGRVRTPRPLLLPGLGPVAGCPRDFHQFTLNLLEPAALLIAFLGQKQMAAVGAHLRCAGAAAEADRTVLDRDRDTLAAAAAGQVPLTLLGGQAMAMGIADVIEDHRLALPRCGTQGTADHLQVGLPEKVSPSPISQRPELGWLGAL